MKILNSGKHYSLILLLLISCIGTLAFPCHGKCEIRPMNTYRYLGIRGVLPPKKWYNWKVFLVSQNRETFDNIEYVTYKFHPTFRSPTRTFYDANISQINLPNHRIAFSAFSSTVLEGWGEFPIEIIIHKNNGTTQKLIHNLKFNESNSSFEDQQLF